MKRENQLTALGTFVFAFGLLAFLPSLMDRELLILAWLGSWQQPVGIAATVVGAVLWGAGKLALMRDAPPPNVVPSAGLEPAEGSPNAIVSPPGPAPAPQPNVLSGQVSSQPNERR